MSSALSGAWMRNWRAWAFLAAFVCESSGTVFIFSALSLPAMLGSVGLAVDFGCYLAGRRHFDDGLQAAALAATRRRIEILLDADEAAWDEDGRDQSTRLYANQYITAVTDTLASYRITLSGDPVVEISRDNGRVTITGTAFFTPLFASVLSVEPWPIVARAAAEIEPRDIEIAIAIDVGSGMGASWGGAPKIDELKDQLPLFMSAVNESSSVKQRHFALIPFSDGVNAGPYTSAVTNGNAGGGSSCVFERLDADNQPYDVPPADIPLVMANAVPASLAGCPAASASPLADIDDRLAAVQSLSTGGGTAGHLGAAWAYYILSRKWSAVWSANAATSDSHKVAFLITGSAFNSWRDQPPAAAPPAPIMQKNSVDQTAATCTQMKNSGITIVTLIFATDAELAGMQQAGSDTYQAMQDCASGSSQAYVARDSYELAMALRNISSTLVSARLVE